MTQVISGSRACAEFPCFARPLFSHPVRLTSISVCLPSLSCIRVTSPFLHTGEKDHYNLDMNDEVVRGSIILNQGEMMWPPPPPPAPAPGTAPASAVGPAKPRELEPAAEPNYFMITMKDALMYTSGLGGLLALGVASPGPAFTTMTTTFSLAGIVGYHTVWSVTPALHSPLMSVTNAISGITAVGGMLLMNGQMYPTNTIEVG